VNEGSNCLRRPAELKNERALVKRLKKGDAVALRQLYESTFAALYRYLYFRANENHDITEDIVHDTFLEAIKSLNGFSTSKGSLQAWLCGIARNRLYEYHRDIEKRTELAQSLGYSRSDRFHGQEQAHETARQDVRARVNYALSMLPEGYTRALIQKYVDLKSVRDIARTAGESEKAVESLLSRARKAFRRHFLEASSTEKEGCNEF